MENKHLSADVLVIGGGTAGCQAARLLSDRKDLHILVADKADIRRSGCLAAGVNALNAYIPENRSLDEWVDYTRNDACRIIREDLVYTVAERFNRSAEELEQLGLVIQKDQNGRYAMRGKWNVKINGENIKPLLAGAIRGLPNVTVLNHLNITDLLTVGNRVFGAVGFSVKEGGSYILRARAVLVATGGASGLYRPNNPGFSRHKMWYSPFNTGAGYAMGIRAGAEMTTFEMRFIALRCKDTIAPTGTIALGVRGKEINAQGKVYEGHYGLKTSDRVYGTLRENLEGRGPCYLNTKGIRKEQAVDLMKAYLNMAPGQTLKWIESGKSPSEQDVEIEGTEPYVVGGHTASGYWVDTGRMTTVNGLFAAGDVAGGTPKKYVTGAMAEAEIAAESILRFLSQEQEGEKKQQDDWEKELLKLEHILLAEMEDFSKEKDSVYGIEEMEEAMQKVMDTYAGGLGTYYQYCEKGLLEAFEKIKALEQLLPTLKAGNKRELLQIYELRERLTVCQTLIIHMQNRQETRWHSFGENQDYPERDDRHWLRYVNTRKEGGETKVIFRELTKRRDYYEHKD